MLARRSFSAEHRNTTFTLIFAEAYHLTSLRRAGDWSSWTDNTCDVVLSSGFLAFASHSGFLKAVDSAGLAVGGVMGTSAGALTGSLYCAGYSPEQVGGSALHHA